MGIQFKLWKSIKCFCIVFQIILYAHTVIDNEKEAKECLNLTSFNTRVPLPVILNQSLPGITNEDHNFLCANELPVYSFSCTLYSNDLIWYFNNETVGGFLPNDSVGHRFTGSFPTSAPVYDVTAVLTQVVPVNEYNVPYCVSILIVQPFDISQLQAMPFTVACQGHCTDDDEVCQVKSYKVAGIYCSDQSNSIIWVD